MSAGGCRTDCELVASVHPDALAHAFTFLHAPQNSMSRTTSAFSGWTTWAGACARWKGQGATKVNGMQACLSHEPLLVPSDLPMHVLPLLQGPMHLWLYLLWHLTCGCCLPDELCGGWGPGASICQGIPASACRLVLLPAAWCHSKAAHFKDSHSILLLQLRLRAFLLARTQCCMCRCWTAVSLWVDLIAQLAGLVWWLTAGEQELKN